MDRSLIFDKYKQLTFIVGACVIIRFVLVLIWSLFVHFEAQSAILSFLFIDVLVSTVVLTKNFVQKFKDRFKQFAKELFLGWNFIVFFLLGILYARYENNNPLSEKGKIQPFEGIFIPIIILKILEQGILLYKDTIKDHSDDRL